MIREWNKEWLVNIKIMIKRQNIKNSIGITIFLDQSKRIVLVVNLLKYKICLDSTVATTIDHK